MAVKSTGTTPADTTPVPPAAASASAEDLTPYGADSDCVVKSDRHFGRAVNGKVCSYHAMHYDAAGKRRQ